VLVFIYCDLRVVCLVCLVSGVSGEIFRIACIESVLILIRERDGT
jgi:hypothetical protein